MRLADIDPARGVTPVGRPRLRHRRPFARQVLRHRVARQPGCPRNRPRVQPLLRQNPDFHRLLRSQHQALRRGPASRQVAHFSTDDPAQSKVGDNSGYVPAGEHHGSRAKGILQGSHTDRRAQPFNRIVDLLLFLITGAPAAGSDASQLACRVVVNAAAMLAGPCAVASARRRLGACVETP